LEQLVSAWRRLKLKDWELHIAGIGPIEEALRKLAQNDSTIVFHGFLGREENARLLCSARLGLNPQDVTRIPGTSFAFKIIEYLAAGLHVISTPRGSLEAELQAGMTYLGDNSAETIAAAIQEVLSTGRHRNTAREATLQIYGADALAGTLGRFFDEVMKAKQLSTGEHQARPSTVATSALAR